MSQYNKTVLTRAGLELAKKANAGQAKFEITRAVTSAEDWSYKTTQDLEEVTNVPNIMQNGTIMDAEEVESNNAVIGVSLRFTNKDLTNGYQIRIIGLYVKEEGAKDEILYALTTAASPEYMPSFADKVLYRFNMQMYLVIGKAQAVNVVIDEGTAVTHSQLDKYKDEVTKSLDALAKTHKEDMGKTVKTASLNGGTKIAPDSNGNIDLTVPNPDLSKYVNIDDLNKLLKGKADVTAIPNKAETENGIKEAKKMARNADNKAQNAMDSKANTSDVYSKSDIDTILSRSFFNKQGMNQQGNVVDVRANATRQPDGGYAFNIWSNDLTAVKLQETMAQVAALNTFKNGIQKDSPDFNDLTTPGNFYITSLSSGKNSPSVSWGNLIVVPANNARIEQIYFPDNGDAPLYRMKSGGSWQAWKQVADKSQVNINSALFRKIVNSNTWSDIFGVNNPNNVLTSLRIDSGGSGQLLNDFAAGIGFGGGDTKGILSVAYENHQARITGGNGNGPVWSEDIAWKSDISNINNLIRNLRPDNNAEALPNGYDLNNHFQGWRRAVNINVKNRPFDTTTDTLYFGGNIDGVDGLVQIAINIGDDQTKSPKIAFRSFGWGRWSNWIIVANQAVVTDHENRIRRLEEKEFEVEVFTDKAAAAAWEAQRPGKRLAVFEK